MRLWVTGWRRVRQVMTILRHWGLRWRARAGTPDAWDGDTARDVVRRVHAARRVRVTWCRRPSDAVAIGWHVDAADDGAAAEAILALSKN